MAEKVIGKLIGLVLLCLVIFLSLYYYYNPKEGLMSKIVEYALGTETLLPNPEQKKLISDESLPQEVINTQEKFMNDISRFKDKQKCLLKLSSLSGLGDFKMNIINRNIINSEVEVISRIEQEGGGGIRKINPIKKDEISICFIEPEPFYPFNECYLIKSTNNVNIQDSYCIISKQYDQYLYNRDFKITSDNIIIIDDQPYRFAKDILFKPEKSKVCFILLPPKYPQNFYNAISSESCDVLRPPFEGCISKSEKTIKYCE